MPRDSHKDLKPIKTPLFQRLAKDSASITVPILMVGFSSAALIAIGLVMVYSSSSYTSLIEAGNASGEAFKQVAFAIGGVLMACLMVKIGSEQNLKGWICLVSWAVCLALVLATLAMGTSALGAQRWLVVGGVSLQASEFAKIALVLMGARIVTEYRDGVLSSWQAVARFFGLVVAPLLLILIAQSDLGTTVICGVALLVMVWMAGLRWQLVLGLVGVVALGGGAMVAAMPYRMARLASFIDPWSDSTDTGYQLVHGLQALASGGLFGQGIGNSFEKMDYLPEAETDFIFSIIGEEMGFVGALLVVVLFGVFLVGAFSIANNSESTFGMLVASSLGAMLVFQAFLNIMCNIGFAPITGKPLPFISSGGSSMVSSCIVMGIILAIGLQGRASAREHARRRDNLHVVSARDDDLASGSVDSRYPEQYGSRTTRMEADVRQVRLAHPGRERASGAYRRGASVGGRRDAAEPSVVRRSVLRDDRNRR